MSKAFEAFSIWFGITATESKTCLSKRNNSFFSMTENKKYWSGLNTFFIEIYIFLRVCRFNNSVSKFTNIKYMKRQNLTNTDPLKYIFINL